MTHSIAQPVMVHLPTQDYLEVDGEHLVIRLKLSLNPAELQRVAVRIEPDNEEHLETMVFEDGFWQARVPVNPDRDVTHYCFKVITEHQQYWLDQLGVNGHIRERRYHFKHHRQFQGPQWLTSQVFYQIFPDRFYNGNPEISVKDEQYWYLNWKPVQAKQWGDSPEMSSGPFEFFGGDLSGVQQKLDYLQKDLGITAIYFNPVFESHSNHKYDTVDYYNVDPHLGGNQALVDLNQALNQRGMRVMLDAVINHTAMDNPWFVDAQKDENSPYRHWYMFGPQENSEADYASWKNHTSLPVLDYSNPEVVEQMVTGEDSVVRHWLRPPYEIDGWRMDVIHMLGEGNGAKNNAFYLQQLRQVIKEENPDAYLLGEHFFEAEQWLQGDQEDGSMNYFGFAHPVRAFLANQDISYDPIRLDAQAIQNWMARARAAIPFANQLCQFNQLGSHDTRRFFTTLNENENLMKVAFGWLFTYLGVPCIYYGDEIGLLGADDPGCRGCFPWDEGQWHQGIYEAVQQLVALRKQSPALQRGGLVDLFAEGDVLAFARVLAGEVKIAVINRGDRASVQIPLGGLVTTPKELSTAFSTYPSPNELAVAEDAVSVELPAQSFALFDSKF